jgi:hypothetical protein
MITKFSSENLKGMCQLEYLVVVGEYNIKVHFKEIGYESVEWMHLAHAGVPMGLL